MFVTFVRDQPSRHAVSHAEQLQASRCARSSGGRLWCGSCHDAHGDTADRAKKVTDVCLSCHADLFRQARHQPASECTSCHMPRLRADNIAHTAVTDHRIPKTPIGSVASQPSEHFRLRPWREPRPEDETRAKGLALVETGLERKDSAMAREGYALLSAETKSRGMDAEEARRLGEVLIDARDFKTAERVLENAELANPKDATLAWLDGLALEKSNDARRAIGEFRRAIALDPSMPEPYLELAALYRQFGNEELRKAIVVQFLEFMPQSVRFRLELRDPGGPRE